MSCAGDGGTKKKGSLLWAKPANYEQQKSKSFKKQIGRMEKMTYDAENDSYICTQGRRLNLRRECTELESGRYIRRHGIAAKTVPAARFGNDAVRQRMSAGQKS